MARRGSHHFVSTVDDIAWITNLRGSDVDYNPVFLAHLLIDPDRRTLFVGAGKVPPLAPNAGRRRRRGLADYEASAAGRAARDADLLLPTRNA